MKICKRCQLEQPETEFYMAKKTGIRRAECRTCVKAYVKRWQQENKGKHSEYVRRVKLRSKYGLTEESFAAMVNRQDGVCAICSNAPAAGDILVVDHSHETDAVRGLLCRMCNLALGHLQDDPALIRRAAAYISTLAA